MGKKVDIFELVAGSVVCLKHLDNITAVNTAIYAADDRFELHVIQSGGYKKKDTIHRYNVENTERFTELVSETYEPLKVINDPRHWFYLLGVATEMVLEKYFHFETIEAPVIGG